MTRLTFTGDVLCYRSQIRGCHVKNDQYDFSSVFKGVQTIFDKSDYVIGSLETAVAGKKAKYTTADTSFNAPDDLLHALKSVGFDLLTTANNHCFDRGVDGLLRTMNQIKKVGLDYTGTRFSPVEKPFLVKDFDGTKVAFVAFTYGTNSASNGCIIPEGKQYLVNLTRKQDLPIHRPFYKRLALSIIPSFLLPKHKPTIVEDCVSPKEIEFFSNKTYEKQLIEIIQDAKQESDIVVVCLHTGGQFNSSIGSYSKHLYELIAQAGANLIVGNHAHTILPAYMEGECIVFPALGNFTFTPKEGYYVENTYADYSVLLHVDVCEGKIVSLSHELCVCSKQDGYGVTLCVDDLPYASLNDKVKGDIIAVSQKVNSSILGLKIIS